MKYNYDELLKRACSQMPEVSLKRERLELPRLFITTVGMRTIISKRASFERLLQRYMESFVICPVCKRPDTKIVKEKRLSFLVCNACGAKSSIKQL